MGHVRGGRDVVEDDAWGGVVSRIELDTGVVEPSATAGLDGFSHVEVVYLFDRVDPAAVCTGARHPRGRTDWPEVGILAQRAKDRPNRIGVTVCQLRAVEVRDRTCTNRYCDVPAERCEVDHVVPWALGGPTEVDNGQLACGYHNRLRERAPP